ncbi:MAG: chemotaxis protein CheX [Treponema sp.]|nr:chemotaxis protein CheX [Treponema sp.]MBQ2552352.1 chemotaxis protein CheX [Treponema sp.]MBQ4236643.1 chemotaxis protein CheX [Treponema sp.]MBQ5384259.1 chemotaxis protein CheX [Treponema sp.]
MEASFLNPFLSACQDAFSQMFNIVPQNKQPYLLNPIGTHPWEISGIVAVSGDEIGIVAFRLHKLLASKMLDISGVMTDSPEEKEAMTKDLVTEFTNIITGNAISAMTTKNISVSAPYILLGENHVISWPRNTHIIGVPFITRQGTFEVDLCFKGM